MLYMFLVRKFNHQHLPDLQSIIGNDVYTEVWEMMLNRHFESSVSSPKQTTSVMRDFE